MSLRKSLSKRDSEMHPMSEEEREFKAHKKQFEKEQMEADDLQDQNWYRIFMTVIWIISGSVMIYYLTQIVSQYHSSKANPSSTIQLIQRNGLPQPQIVICNWNQNGNVTNPIPVGDCDVCGLTLLSCSTNALDGSQQSCDSSWSQNDTQTAGGLFSCWQFNADPKNLKYSVTTGYTGSMATLWAIPYLERDDPPINRMGLQATFKPVGTVTPYAIYDEVNFAPMGFDTFFALTYTNTIHNEHKHNRTLYNTSSFDTSASMVNLLQATDPDWNDELNSTSGYVGITFGYQTLSLQQVNFDIAYNLNNLFGDFAGMIGTLMGLDLIKLAAGLPMGYLAWKSRSWKPMQEAFNG